MWLTASEANRSLSSETDAPDGGSSGDEGSADRPPCVSTMAPNAASRSLSKLVSPSKRAPAPGPTIACAATSAACAATSAARVTSSAARAAGASSWAVARLASPAACCSRSARTRPELEREKPVDASLPIGRAQRSGGAFGPSTFAAVAAILGRDTAPRAGWRRSRRRACTSGTSGRRGLCRWHVALGGATGPALLPSRAVPEPITLVRSAGSAWAGTGAGCCWGRA
jgi:hypothetical protein